MNAVDERREMPCCRRHFPQKVQVANSRTVYLSVHHSQVPAKLFLRVNGEGCTTEVIALYDVIARLSSLALQYGAPLDKVAGMFHNTKFAPAGPVTGRPRIKHCCSLPDLIGRHLLIDYCGREDLAHVS